MSEPLRRNRKGINERSAAPCGVHWKKSSVKNQSRGNGQGHQGRADDPADVRARTVPVPRLYVVTPAVSDATAIAGALNAVLDTTDVAAVLLRLEDADERGLINRVKAVAPAVQAAGTALLLEGRAGLVARAGADGAHLAGLDALQASVPMLKPKFIAGAGGLYSRHDAMVVAETGADYVMFGEPDVAGQHPSRDAVIERIAWWAEVFEIPCVGYAITLDAIDALVAAGADFVAVGNALFEDPRGPQAAAAEAAARLTVVAETTT
jgi:thiamine-phosphate pyrophosphorylase